MTQRVRRPARSAAPESTAATTLASRRARRPAAPAAPAPTPARQATRIIARTRTVEDPDALVVRAPNTEELYCDAIKTVRTEFRPARGGEYLHVSDLIHRCIRAKAISEVHTLAAPMQRLSMSDVFTFAQGDAIHDAAKAKARDGSPQMVWGKWSCKCEFLFHTEPCTYSAIDQEETCPHCLSKVDRYHEVSMFDDEYMVVGNPDLVFLIPRSKAFHVTEIKSISHEQWKDLTRPKPEHVFQVVWYWHLMQRKGYKMTDRVSVVYITKGWLFGSQSNIKEFMIDPREELHRLADMIADAKAYKDAREGGALPTRTCAAREAKAAQECHVCDVCFEV